jgi:site-specific recombinase XerD
MAIVKDLDQTYVDTQLVCPPGKSQVEVVDPQRTGLYIEVRAGTPHHTYYLRCKDHAGKTCRRRIGRTNELSLEQARVAAAQAKAEIRGSAVASIAVPPQRPAFIQRASSTDAVPTLDTFWTEHYVPFAKIRKRSFGRDEQLYRLRIKSKFGHLPLTGITRLSVQQFQDSLLAEGLAPASANHHVQLMRRFFSLATSWQMLDRNVLKGIELFHLDNLVEHYLDDEQVDHLVKTLSTHKNRMVSRIILFLLSTGARLREGLCAQWKDVDVPNAVWRIPATNSKSKKLKSLPLNSSALWVIEQLDSEGKSRYLFPSPASGNPYTTITRAWYLIRKAAGIPDNVRIHDLRHTFASRLVSAGRSMVEVQNLLGHADPRVSQRYAHLSSKSALAASNAAAFAVG